MGHKSVGDVMTVAVVSVGENTPYQRVAQTLAAGRVGAAAVLDDPGRVIGVVFETDLIGREEHPDGGRRPFWLGLADRRTARADTARGLMTRPAITIGPDATLAEAARCMGRHRISHLPGIDHDVRLVGIVSRRDLLGVFVVSDEQIREAVMREVIRCVLWEHPGEVDVGVRDGVVTLCGRVERASQIPVAVRFSHRLDGVVDVIDHLDYVHDDTLFTVPRA